MAEKKKSERLSYPALLLSQNNRRFYLTTIPVDNLFPSCFVSRRDEDAEQGFQRALNESRALDISKYLADGSGSIPSNIVLSAQEGAAFSYNRKTKSISYLGTEGIFLVLDGQHRLWGYQKCPERHRVPVTIYEGLTRADEAKLFIDINTTQRGVPAALLLDIKNLAHMEGQKESILRDFFDRLNEDSQSALAGKLSPSKSVVGKISRVTFNKAVGHALSSNILMETPLENQYRVIRNFINAFDAELVDADLLTRSVFFEAIFDVFETVVFKALSKKNVKQDSLQKFIAPLARLDYRGTGSRSLLAKNSIVTLMNQSLRSTSPISVEML